MTVITVKTSGPIETFYFNPPLPPAKKIEILNFECLVPFSRRIILEIVDPSSHYSNFVKKIDYQQLKIKPERLVAYAGCFIVPTDENRWRIKTICSEKFPIVGVQKSKDPINSIKIIVENMIDSDTLDLYDTCSVCLKIYH